MKIKKLVIKNFKSLKNIEIELNQHLSIIVGDNETGKSTLLEAIHLVLSGEINGRSVQSELNPYFFNNEAVNEYLDALRNGRKTAPPSLLIEAYLEDHENLARLKGTNNSAREDCPGIVLSIEFDEEYSAEYAEYIKSPEQIRTIPVEYYVIKWYSFSYNNITSRSVPVDTTMIDTSLSRAGISAHKYILKIISDVLEPKQRVDLALSYRKLKGIFLDDDGVKKINAHLADRKGDITDKELSISMDVSGRSTWESGLTPHLDEIPFLLAGRGEQSSIKMKLAMEASSDSHIFLIEEPENHLSYPNMNSLIKKIGAKGEGKQIIVTTHSSFVLNKLGVDNVILFNRNRSMKLNSLTKETEDYFMKLPGHDTLRLILSKKAILVEGSSDELIVQKAFLKKYGMSPLERGVDVISVQSLAFKRFLEIGILLDLRISVVTDNDGDVEQLKQKYSEYLSREKIRIYYDDDTKYRTLEPQMLKANSLDLLNQVLGKEFYTPEALLEYMGKNKADCALKIFNSTININFPEYIENAIS